MRNLKAISPLPWQPEKNPRWLEKMNESQVEDLGKYFQHIILLSDNEFKYVVPDIDYLTSFRKLEILPFGNVNRGELINLWNSLGRKETINSRELHKLNDEFTVHINAIIRRNLIPLKPFFILTVLQSLESMRPADYSLTSYGHCYQYLIMRSLENVKIAPQEIDTYMNYLTELAFFIFGREKSDISLKDFENKFAKGYSDKFFCKSHKVIIDTLKMSQIILVEEDRLFFKYRYILYFFAAKYIADHIDEVQAKDIISKLCKNIHFERNANILIFITHHTKNAAILDEIQYKAIELFSTEIEAKLYQDDVDFIKFVDKIPSLEFDKPNIEEERRKKLRTEDEFEAKALLDDKEYEVTNQESDKTKLYLALINQAIKTIEIIGQIARNRYGSLNKKQLEEIIETAYGLGLRLLQRFLKDTSAAKIDIINTISDLIKRKTNKSDHEIQDHARKNFLLLCYGTMYSILKKIAFSIGSENIIDIYRKILEEKPLPSIKLINLAIELQFTKKIDKKLIESFERDFQSNPVCALILREIVVQYLYLHHVDYKDMQWIASTLRISMRSQRLIDATKTTKIQ